MFFLPFLRGRWDGSTHASDVRTQPGGRYACCLEVCAVFACVRRPSPCRRRVPGFDVCVRARCPRCDDCVAPDGGRDLPHTDAPLPETHPSLSLSLCPRGIERAKTHASFRRHVWVDLVALFGSTWRRRADAGGRVLDCIAAYFTHCTSARGGRRYTRSLARVRGGTWRSGGVAHSIVVPRARFRLTSPS